MSDAAPQNQPGTTQRSTASVCRHRLLTLAYVVSFGFCLELLLMKLLPALKSAIGVQWVDLIDALAVGAVIVPLAGLVVWIRERHLRTDAQITTTLTLRPWMHGVGAAMTFFLLAALCLWTQNWNSDRIIKQNLDEDLLMLAKIAASRLDVEAHSRINRPEQQNSAEYNAVVAPLREMLRVTERVRYLYTVRKTPEGIRFIVDAAEPIDADGDGVIDQATLNELYPDADEAMLAAFATGQPAVSKEPYTDKWGTFISAFVPLRTKQGDVECVLGLDVTAKNYLLQLRVLDNAVYVGCTMALLVGMALGAGVYVIQHHRECAVDALAHSKRLIELITDNTTDLVGLSDCEGKTLYCTPSVERTLGWSEEERDQMPWIHRVHPDDCATVVAASEGNRRGIATKIRYRALRADGKYLWLECSASPVKTATGQVEAVAWSSRDVTQQVEADLQLKDSEARLSATIAALGEGVVVQNSTGVIIDCNPEACAILGLTRDQLLGRASVDARWHTIREDGSNFNGEDHPASQTLRTGQRHRDVLMGVHHPDGTLRWISINTEAVCDRDGATVMVVASFADVTQQREINRKMQEAKESAEEASRAKSEFLANMSHEIRTPMTAILGYTELLAEESDEPSSEQRHDAIATIRRNGEHLLSIINDILDVAKIEAGKMTVEQVPTDPAEILDDVIRLLSVRANAKGISLSCNYFSAIPRHIPCDPVRLRQILVNLIGNAIKFTEVGEVSVRVHFDSTESTQGRLRFEIADSGIGMTQEQLGRLFGAFQQADSSTTRKFGGSGLGLRISRKLAEMLGGEISVSSEIGKGSVFVVQLPAGVVEPGDLWTPTSRSGAMKSERKLSLPPNAVIGPLTGARILLAEDGPDNQRLISLLLRRAGATVTVVNDGRMCVEALSTTDSSNSNPAAVYFDLILMDMQMPGIDGFTAARMLRQQSCTIPIIALTAHSLGSDRDRCLEAGCDHFVSKPIDRAKLIEVCRTAMKPSHLV